MEASTSTLSLMRSAAEASYSTPRSVVTGSSAATHPLNPSCEAEVRRGQRQAAAGGARGVGLVCRGRRAGRPGSATEATLCLGQRARAGRCVPLGPRALPAHAHLQHIGREEPAAPQRARHVARRVAGVAVQHHHLGQRRRHLHASTVRARKAKRVWVPPICRGGRRSLARSPACAACARRVHTDLLESGDKGGVHVEHQLLLAAHGAQHLCVGPRHLLLGEGQRKRRRLEPAQRHAHAVHTPLSTRG